MNAFLVRGSIEVSYKKYENKSVALFQALRYEFCCLSLDGDFSMVGQQYILMKNSQCKRSLLLLLLFLSLLPSSLQQCALNCTATTPNAYCSSQGYCTCSPNYIFNCNTPATYATDNSYLRPLSASQPYYYIMQSQLGKELEYTVTFSDPNNANILNTYQPDFYTDQGMYYPPTISYVLTSKPIVQPYMFSCTFRITLNNITGSGPEKLILMVNISNPTLLPSLYFSYSYTMQTSGSSIYLILGYVAGGLLVATSILFIVLIYRKRRPRRQQQPKQENLQFDITHFNLLMPETMISPEHRRDNTTCSVCLQEYDFNATVRMTACLHLFHTACIDQWCRKNLSCPNCRTDLTRQNILALQQQRAEKQKKLAQNQWIINSLAEQDEPSTLRNPLSGNDNL